MAELITITEAEDGARLDRWLKKKYPQLPFTLLQKVLRTGQIRVNGKRVKGDARLEAGQEVRIPPQMNAPVKKDKHLSEEDKAFIRSLVLYQDKYIIALNKPAGIATQGGSKVRWHIDGLLDGLAQDGVRPHLVHRLDKETTGVLLLARNAKVAKALGDKFKGREIRKYYWGITVPAPQVHQGKIVTVVEAEEGSGKKDKQAVTFYQVLETAGKNIAFVAFWPRTGRKHQIRLHALEMGCPLLGDDKYVRARPQHFEKDEVMLEEQALLPKGLHLHARRIIMKHPVTQQRLDITAPLNADMKKTWKFFGFDANDVSDPFEELEL